VTVQPSRYENRVSRNRSLLNPATLSSCPTDSEQVNDQFASQQKVVHYFGRLEPERGYSSGCSGIRVVRVAVGSVAMVPSGNRSTYTTTEQILHRWGRFTGTPFQCGSGSVPTVVLRDHHACELCDAPVQPTRCPLLPRESCSALVSMVE